MMNAAILCFSVGYYVKPTFVETKDPMDKIMTEEIFGPVLTAYIYRDGDVDKTLQLLDSSTSYALTGAVFAKDEYVLASTDFLCREN